LTTKFTKTVLAWQSGGYCLAPGDRCQVSPGLRDEFFANFLLFVATTAESA